MQKWKYLLPTLWLLGVSAAGAQGWSSTAPITNAKSVSEATSDQPVKLRGEIVGQRDSDKYVFADNSGSVLVNVAGNTVNRPLEPGTPVEIVGEVASRTFGGPQVDARAVTVLASNGVSYPAPMNDDFLHHTPD